MSSRRILLDTNVLSEIMRPRPDAAVLAWFDAGVPGARFLVSAITHAEILLGIALLAVGKKRAALEAAAQQMFEQEFLHANLPFDEGAAIQYSALVAHRLKQGLPMSTEDAQIASIALHHKLPLATRNVSDFAGIPGLTLINPWDRG